MYNHHARVLARPCMVVQRLDSAIHQIKVCSLDNTIGFPNKHPLNSDLSGGQRYPTFEQPGPELYHCMFKGI